MTSFLSSVFPSQEGLLPKWLLVVRDMLVLPRSQQEDSHHIVCNSSDPIQVSVISVLNSAQAYSTLKFTQRVYSASPASVTALSARTFGTWTFLSSVIRLYAAYHIDDPTIYQLAMWTYGIAFLHFVSEWQVYKTARWGAGLAGPAFVATGSLLWMVTQWGFYVRGY